MTPQFTIAKELAESAFLTIRIVLGLTILIVLAVCFRRAIIIFAGERYRELGGRKLWLAGANLLAVVVMELMKAPAEKLLTAIGGAIGPLLQIPEPHWLATALIGLYHTIAVALGLVLAIRVVGAWYWFVEGRLEVWGTMSKIPADARLHLLKAVARLNRVLRAVLLTVLMLEAASRTEHILREPSPQVWQTKLGDYAVTYELRAWTDRPEDMFDVHSALRRNVLDAFNHAGVEIMTPSILGHRDASRLAVPQEAFPERPAARGIAVKVEPQR